MCASPPPAATAVVRLAKPACCSSTSHPHHANLRSATPVLEEHCVSAPARCSVPCVVEAPPPHPATAALPPTPPTPLQTAPPPCPGIACALPLAQAGSSSAPCGPCRLRLLHLCSGAPPLARLPRGSAGSSAAPFMLGCAGCSSCPAPRDGSLHRVSVQLAGHLGRPLAMPVQRRSRVAATAPRICQPPAAAAPRGSPGCPRQARPPRDPASPHPAPAPGGRLLRAGLRPLPAGLRPTRPRLGLSATRSTAALPRRADPSPLHHGLGWLVPTSRRLPARRAGARLSGFARLRLAPSGQLAPSLAASGSSAQAGFRPGRLQLPNAPATAAHSSSHRPGPTAAPLPCPASGSQPAAPAPCASAQMAGSKKKKEKNGGWSPATRMESDKRSGRVPTADCWVKNKERKEVGWDKEKKRQTRLDDPSICFATWTVSHDPHCRLCQAGWTASCSDDTPSGCAKAPPRRKRRQSSCREIRPNCSAVGPNLGGYTQRVR
ncbi:hypothetical protein VPH35_089603 [Triticum aestivum]